MLPATARGVLRGAACLCCRQVRQSTCHATASARDAGLAANCLLAAVGLQQPADVLSHVSSLPVAWWLADALSYVHGRLYAKQLADVLEQSFVVFLQGGNSSSGPQQWPTCAAGVPTPSLTGSSEGSAEGPVMAQVGAAFLVCTCATQPSFELAVSALRMLRAALHSALCGPLLGYLCPWRDSVGGSVVHNWAGRIAV